MANPKIRIDDAIMEELLNEPSVRKHVLKMRPAELVMFKQLLVAQGTYGRYAEERKPKRKRHK